MPPFIVTFILKMALKKFIRDVNEHVKKGGWNQPVKTPKTRYNYRNRFEPARRPEPEPEEKTPGNHRHGEEKIMTGEQVAGLVRHLLTTLGGLAAGFGWMDESAVVGVAGAVATLIGFAWSMMAKVR